MGNDLINASSSETENAANNKAFKATYAAKSASRKKIIGTVPKVRTARAAFNVTPEAESELLLLAALAAILDLKSGEGGRAILLRGRA